MSNLLNFGAQGPTSELKLISLYLPFLLLPFVQEFWLLLQNVLLFRWTAHCKPGWDGGVTPVGLRGKRENVENHLKNEWEAELPRLQSILVNPTGLSELL